MEKYTYVSNSNPEFIESLYQSYKNDPDSIESKWRAFFDGFDFSEEVRIPIHLN